MENVKLSQIPKTWKLKLFLIFGIVFITDIL